MPQVIRPPRTNAHRERDALLQRFHDADLVAVVSTNGGIPEADIQIEHALLAEGGTHGEVLHVRLTERGRTRLAAFEKPVAR